MSTQDLPISLRIGNVDYLGWESVDVRIGIEQMAGCFELRCADRWAMQGQQMPSLPGSACRIRISDRTVITGWIDEVAVQYGDGEHTVTIRGRDRTGDLVDTSALTDGSGWMNRSLAQIATTLASSLSIPVTIDAAASADAAKIFQYSHVQPCETAFDALSRLARMRGLLLISDGLGSLRITRAGTQRANTALILGENILGASSSVSHAERFNVYRVIAQARESDTLSGQTAQQILEEVRDPVIRAGRITTIEAYDSADAADAKKIAQWARSTRAAAGERATFRVRGWMDGDRPWRANCIIPVRDPWTRFVGDYLISAVRFSVDTSGGELTELTVTPPAAYTPLTVKEQSPTANSSYQIPAAPEGR